MILMVALKKKLLLDSSLFKLSILSPLHCEINWFFQFGYRAFKSSSWAINVDIV